MIVCRSQSTTSYIEASHSNKRKPRMQWKGRDKLTGSRTSGSSAVHVEGEAEREGGCIRLRRLLLLALTWSVA